MISTYAIINSSNIVTDVNMWDGNTSTWSPASGFIAVGVGIGTTSDNKWIGSPD